MATAGYSVTPLPKKLGIGASTRLAVIDGPADQDGLLGGPCRRGAALDSDRRGDQPLHLFVTQREALGAHLRSLRSRISPAAAGVGLVAEEGVEGPDDGDRGRDPRTRAAARVRRRQGLRGVGRVVGAQARRAQTTARVARCRRRLVLCFVRTAGRHACVATPPRIAVRSGETMTTKRFLAITGSPVAIARWRALPEAERSARQATGMAAWMKWSQDHRDAIVEPGGPLGRTNSRRPEGITDVRNAMAAFTIVQAESHEAAARLFESHPHFALFAGAGVEIMEILPVPALR